MTPHHRPAPITPKPLEGIDVMNAVSQTKSPTITELCMELERMRLMEEYHQRVCRSLMADTGCAACDQHEAAWLAADRAITVFLAAVK